MPGLQHLTVPLVQFEGLNWADARDLQTLDLTIDHFMSERSLGESLKHMRASGVAALNLARLSFRLLLYNREKPRLPRVGDLARQLLALGGRTCSYSVTFAVSEYLDNRCGHDAKNCHCLIEGASWTLNQSVKLELGRLLEENVGPQGWKRDGKVKR
jgi:hypothetical protein